VRSQVLKNAAVTSLSPRCQADQDNIASSGPECGDEQVGSWRHPRSAGKLRTFAFTPGRDEVLGA